MQSGWKSVLHFCNKEKEIYENVTEMQYWCNWMQ